MEWWLLGYKEYPFSVNPILIDTLDLFTGHEKEIAICENVLADKNIRLVIEGARGVGTTSFANYLKFVAQKKKQYFAPRDEIGVENNWNLESLLTAVISTIVRELELTHEKEVKNNKIFLEAKSLSHRISEAYNNFGVTAFSFGASHSKTGMITQPIFVSSITLGHHLEDLGRLVLKLGYKNGVLIQLNNLDLGIVHTEEHLEYLFNAARDFFQINNISWLLVGDLGLKSFISRCVDRLDDIISDEVVVKSLNKKVYHELIKKRLDYYKIKKEASFPLKLDVFDYLYEITDGRLRYIFGLVYTLINRLQIGRLVQSISSGLAKDAIVALAKERMQKFELTKMEVIIVEVLVSAGEQNVADLAKNIDKNRTYVSRTLNKLLAERVVSVRQVGKQRIYSPSLDAKVAYAG